MSRTDPLIGNSAGSLIYKRRISEGHESASGHDIILHVPSRGRWRYKFLSARVLKRGLEAFYIRQDFAPYTPGKRYPF